jgi:hypothetical protein
MSSKIKLNNINYTSLKKTKYWIIVESPVSKLPSTNLAISTFMNTQNYFLLDINPYLVVKVKLIFDIE